MDSRAVENVREFYEAHGRALHTYAVALLGDRQASEDLVHGVFERLLRRLFLPRELRPYVYRAIRNAAFDLRRRELRAPNPDSVYAEVSPVSAAEEFALRDEAEHLLGLLTDDERECVTMKLFNGLTFQEIAQIRRVSINTAASWYRRAIERMKAQAMEIER